MIDDKNITVKNIDGKFHYFLDVVKVPFDQIDLYVKEIEKRMKKVNPKRLNPQILASWSFEK